ncbi:hypothetical protein DIPPA_20478 [Diplonema papillatum]|nr:hypothetical protein DIPPA_20478 [Diplonema papillatum]
MGASPVRRRGVTTFVAVGLLLWIVASFVSNTSLASRSGVGSSVRAALDERDRELENLESNVSELKAIIAAYGMTPAPSGRKGKKRAEKSHRREKDDVDVLEEATDSPRSGNTRDADTDGDAAGDIGQQMRTAGLVKSRLQLALDAFDDTDDQKQDSSALGDHEEVVPDEKKEQKTRRPAKRKSKIRDKVINNDGDYDASEPEKVEDNREEEVDAFETKVPPARAAKGKKKKRGKKKIAQLLEEADSESDEDADTYETAKPRDKKKAKRKPASEPETGAFQNEKGTGRGIDALGVRETLEDDPPDTFAVVIFTYRRAEMLKKCIERVLSLTGDDPNFRIFVSQDGRSTDVDAVIESFASQVTRLIHDRNDTGATAKEKRLHFEPYYAIAHHYGWAMNEIFSVSSYNRLVILEEDLEVANDFFEYMRAASPLLDDDTFFCVSAWNDNGQANLVADEKALYLTDFFPGLGWMLSRKLWQEMRRSWPAGFWDDWMRQPRHRNGRVCLRPEIPRSFMWCDAGGVSRGQFCREHLSRMKLDDRPVKWGQDVDYSRFKKPAYDNWLDGVIAKATPARDASEISGGGDFVFYYTTNYEFREIASQFGLMTDFKDNVPRTAYRGIVTFRWKGSRVHLASRFILYE